MPVTTGSDAAPPRALGEGMPMPATAVPMAAAPIPAAPTPAAPETSTPVKQSTPTTSHASSASSSASSSTSSTVRRYAIGEGDSFSTFAARYGVSEARIAALNPGVDSTSLTIGQSLRVR
jgi:LysM repeat protein